MDIRKTIITFAVILILAISGYFVWKKYSNSNVNPSLNNPVASEEDLRLKTIDRDIQRSDDLQNIGLALLNYSKDNSSQFPETSNTEKISDENSNTFKLLKNGGYISILYQDPIPDKYYYGYVSNGSRFDLTSVLENQNDSRCMQNNNICIYKITSEELKTIMNMNESYTEDYFIESYIE